MIYKQRPKEMWTFNLEKRKSNRADRSSNMTRQQRGAVLAACRGRGREALGKAVHYKLGEGSMQEELPIPWQWGRQAGHCWGVSKATGMAAQSTAAFCLTLGAPAPCSRLKVCSLPAPPAA